MSWMTLLDAGREFARLTGGLAVPKEHVELVQCVLNKALGQLYSTATTVWHSIPDDKRANIPEVTMNRLSELLQFLQQSADAAKTGEWPALAAERQKESALAHNTKDNTTIVPLLLASDTVLD
jgi:hypothetical protein